MGLSLSLFKVISIGKPKNFTAAKIRVEGEGSEQEESRESELVFKCKYFEKENTGLRGHIGKVEIFSF